MIPDSWREAARALVAGWPPLGDEGNREITAIAHAHAARVRREAILTPQATPRAA